MGILEVLKKGRIVELNKVWNRGRRAEDGDSQVPDLRRRVHA